MHYSVEYATGEAIFLFQQRVARRLASEQVVPVMDELYDNNIPSDSNDEELGSGDGETDIQIGENAKTFHANMLRK